MRMRGLLFRAIRVTAVAMLTGALYLFLEPRGYGWGALVIGIGLVGLFSLLAYRRQTAISAKYKAEARWAAALLQGSLRPAALREVTAALEEAKSQGVKGRAEQIRLSVCLAELLEADAQVQEAEAVLRGFDLSITPVEDAVAIRHALAVISLRAERPEAAYEILHGRPRCADRHLEMRLDLVEASARVEMGFAEEALEVAAAIRRAAGGDEALLTEARITRAVALHAMGEVAEARELVRSMGEEMAQVLVHRGQPRLASLAEDVLGGS